MISEPARVPHFSTSHVCCRSHGFYHVVAQDISYILTFLRPLDRDFRLDLRLDLLQNAGSVWPRRGPDEVSIMLVL